MENIMWLVIDFTFVCVNILLTYLFFKAFLKTEQKVSIALKISVVFVIIVIKFLMSYFFNENMLILSFVSILSAFFVGVFCFQSKIYWIGAAAFFVSIAGVVSELLAAVVITGLQGVPVDTVMQLNIYRIQGRTLSSLFLLVIIVLVGHFRKSSIRSPVDFKLMLVMCVLPMVSISIVHRFVVYIIATDHVLSIYDILPLFSIIAVNIFIFTMFESIIGQNEKIQNLTLLEVQSEAQRKHIQQLIDTQDQIRKMSHDFKHYVHELYILCVEERYEDLLEKLSELSNRRSKSSLVNTGNIMLDSVLTSKIEEIDKHCIELRKILDVQAELHYIDVEICVLLGNALDNAIEACMKSSNAKFIGIELIATPKLFLCNIINSIGVKPQERGGFLQTSKENTLHHGIGLQSMMQTCESLGGEMVYEFDESFFDLWIKIPFMENSK